MPDEMTPERALIILNQCNTDGRIKVDREELKEAVKVACEAIRLRIPRKPVKNKEGGVECPDCGETVDTYIYPDLFCSACGQAIDWSDLD